MMFLTKRERPKKHTNTHKIQKRKEKKHTHTHTIRCTVGKEARKEGRNESGSSLPFASLCQNEPAAHQFTMKDG
jgi:hypothetical protein